MFYKVKCAPSGGFMSISALTEIVRRGLPAAPPGTGDGQFEPRELTHRRVETAPSHRRSSTSMLIIYNVQRESVISCLGSRARPERPQRGESIVGPCVAGYPEGLQPFQSLA